MAPEGIIVSRTDKNGNRMAFPEKNNREKGSRLCVLIGSNGNPEYSFGKRVLWLVSSQGERVDFSRTYHVLSEEDLPRDINHEDIGGRTEGPIELVVYAHNRMELLLLGELGVLGRGVIQETFSDRVSFVQSGMLFDRYAALYRCTSPLSRKALSETLCVDETRVVDIETTYDLGSCMQYPDSASTKHLADIVFPHLREYPAF